MNIAIAIETPKHGFDGQPPLMRDPRDLHGKGRRKIEATQNSNCDRLEWLLSHGKITECQLDAGRRLQADCELAQIGGFSAAGSGGPRLVNLASSNLPDAKLDAIARVGAARASLTPGAWLLVELVAVQNIQLAEAGRRLWGHCGRGEPVGAIRFALDALAQFYGMA